MKIIKTNEAINYILFEVLIVIAVLSLTIRDQLVTLPKRSSQGTRQAEGAGVKAAETHNPK